MPTPLKSSGPSAMKFQTLEQIYEHEREWRRAEACQCGHDARAIELLRKCERALTARWDVAFEPLVIEVRAFLIEATGTVAE